MSSHEVVLRVRRIAGMKRVGHAGTLDPSACGVLVVCLGQATRLSDYIATEWKSYRAEFTFGLTTDSEDAEGDVVTRVDASHLTEAMVYSMLPRFIGTYQQRPPDRSAVWINGERAYHLARRGQEMAMPMREVSVMTFSPVCFTPGLHPRLIADITCSKGTYIRSLARDLGQDVATGAVLSFLARTQVGGSCLDDAVTIDELRDAADQGEFARYLQPPDTPLTHIPALAVPLSPATENYRKGNPMASDADPGLYRVYVEGHFAGLGRTAEGMLRSVVNFQQ